MEQPIRPLFVEEGPDERKNVSRMHMGTKGSGIVVDVTRKGIEISGYYASQRDACVLHANLQDPIVILWEELEKVRREVTKKRGSGEKGPDFTDETPDEIYLSGLPKVTINGSLFYIDPVRRERRLVDRPINVYRY